MMIPILEIVEDELYSSVGKEKKMIQSQTLMKKKEEI
jgi:hypothetical protein